MKNKSLLHLKSIALAILLVAPLFSMAQDSNLGNWLIYIGNKKLNNGWNIHNEVQYRNYDAVGDLEQLLLRTGVGYNLTENNNNLLLGYGYILSENYINDNDKVSVNEHRIFQQFTTKQKAGKLGLTHRYRFEQRFVEDDFKMRFRYFLSFNYPLMKAEEGQQSPLYLSAYNEIFLNTKSSVFDRNRVYGGLGYRFSKALRMELGYMNQFFETSGRDQINLIAFVNF